MCFGLAQFYLVVKYIDLISIINKTQLQNPTDCFTPWGGSSGGPKPTQ